MTMNQPPGSFRANAATHTLDRVAGLKLNSHFTAPAFTAPDRSFQSLLHLFEVVLSHGRVTDPRVILQAVNGYIASNQQPAGIALFDGILNAFGDGYDAETRATYLGGLGILRATYAEQVPLMRRIGWVRDSFKLLEEGLKITDGQHPVAHWAAGMVYSQVPGFFGKRKAARQHLQWLIDRPETEPVLGFYREVYRQLAALDRAGGRTADAEQNIAYAGYTNYAPQSLFMGWFTNGPDGTDMAPYPVIDQIVPGRVFALYGFGFADIYFVLSDDGRHLIAVDAGTHPRSLKAAHEYLLAAHPDLPPVTTALITHAHWDHVGGHQYLRELNPDIAIYGSDKYRAVTERVMRTHSYDYFRGADFDHDWIDTYAPTHPVSARTTISVGGSTIDLIPVTGGETEDAMLISFPGLKTVFVGDIVMPWYGEPWVNEGFVATAGDAMDSALACNADHILHGHHPLTMLFGAETLGAFRELHRWLVDLTAHYVAIGYSATDIIRMNPVAPALLDQPELTLSFAAARESIIKRTADTMVGIWREDRTGQSPEGLDLITTADRGRMLEAYLNLSPRQVTRLIRRMLDNGDNELALQTAVAAEQRYGAKPGIIAAKEAAADRLRSVNQFVDPFKFTTYSEIIGRPLEKMQAPATQKGPKA